MFGDGMTQGSRVWSQYMSRCHRSIGAISSVAPMPKCIVEEPRQLADRHPVAHRDRELADERLEARHQRRALDLDAANRIRPIADDDRDAVAGRGAQAVGHRVDVGVDPRPDVLQVDHQDVDAA